MLTEHYPVEYPPRAVPGRYVERAAEAEAQRDGSQDGDVPECAAPADDTAEIGAVGAREERRGARGRAQVKVTVRVVRFVAAIADRQPDGRQVACVGGVLGGWDRDDIVAARRDVDPCLRVEGILPERPGERRRVCEGLRVGRG